MPSLEEVNERWRTTGNPHAVLVDVGNQAYQIFCPICSTWPPGAPTLGGAMNDALAHKRNCPALS